MELSTVSYRSFVWVKCTLVMHCNCVVNMSQGDTVGLFIESNNSWAILIKNCIFGGYLIQAL